jgi:Mrp family chromosome partitioning ATPase
MTAIRLEPSPKFEAEYDLLKNRLLAAINGKSAGPYALAFTSCERGEGVSTIASNFAAHLAQDPDRQVLLVDGDLVHPTLHKLFRVRASKEAPEGESPSRELSLPAWRVYRSAPNMDVLLARSAVESHRKVFAPGAFEEFLKRAKQRYEFVLLDCPPLKGAGAAPALPSKADGVVLVVEAERVRREALQRAIIQLEDAGASLLGVILNKRRYPIPGLIYRLL